MGRFRNAVYLCQLVFVLLPLVAFAGKDEIPTPISAVAFEGLGSNRGLGAPYNPTGGLCDNGTQQSPVMIYTPGACANAILPRPVNVKSVRATGVFTHNNNLGSTEMRGPFGTLTLGGVTFTFDSLHFHFYSEHTFWANRILQYPMEMHVEYKNAAGELAVVAQFFQFGDASPFFSQFLDHLSEMKSGPVTIRNIDLPSFDGPYYRYMGSMTTAPCTEGVIWTVLTTPKTMSTTQWNQYLGYPHYLNSRQTQSLNNQNVYTTTQSTSAELRLPYSET